MGSRGSFTRNPEGYIGYSKLAPRLPDVTKILSDSHQNFNGLEQQVIGRPTPIKISPLYSFVINRENEEETLYGESAFKNSFRTITGQVSP